MMTILPAQHLCWAASGRSAVGSAPALGAGGREFESRRPDQPGYHWYRVVWPEVYKGIVRIPYRRFSWLVSIGAAILAPVILTALLLAINPGTPRDYVFLYLAIVAVLGVGSGLRAAVLSATISFLLLDFLFVHPVHSFEFADRTDLLNLSVFLGAAGLVGTLGSNRRASQLRAEALASELQQANIELARLAETERQIRALEETDRVRRELLANVSHELRTPLGSILTGATDMLERGSLPEDLHVQMGDLATEARRLNRLVSDMLDMSRIEGGILDLQLVEVDLSEALQAAVDRLWRQNPARSVVVDVPDSTPEVMADWDRLGQVLDNLLGNADHAAPPDSPIRISAVVSDTAEVVVRVIDAGPGVPFELQKRIFERFVRGGGTNSDRGAGTGLGLAIVQGLVEAQGGRVWLEDPEPGEGGRFAFSIPAAGYEGEREP